MKHDSRSELITRAAGLLLAYLGVAILVTWPLILHLRTHLAGLLGVENLGHTLWLYWQKKQFMFELAGKLWSDPSRNLFDRLGELIHGYLNFPFVISMSNGFDFWLNLPLEWWAGNPSYYNLKLLVIIALNGVGGYLLICHLTRDRAAAFLGGLFFAANPYTLYCLSVGRMMEAILFWMPLYVRELFLLAEEPGLARGVRAGLWLGLASLTYWFYGHFLLIFTIAFCIYHAFTGRPFRLGARAWAFLGVAMVVAFLVVLPDAMPYLSAQFHGQRLPGMVRPDPATNPSPRQEMQAFVIDSANLDYLWRRQPVENSMWLPSRNRLGVTIGILALVPLFFLRRWNYFWVALAMLTWLMPMGPFLKWGGDLVGIGGQLIPLPYLFFYRYLPLFYKLIWPGQAMALALLGLATLAALNFSGLCSQYLAGRPAKFQAGVRAGLVVLLALIMLLEMFVQNHWPLALSPLVPPSIYTGATQAIGGVVELPANRYPLLLKDRFNRDFYWDNDFKLVNYYQTFHHGLALWGRCRDLAGADQWMFDPSQLGRNSFLTYLASRGFSADSFFEPDDRVWLRSHGIRLVVVHEKFACHSGERGAYNYSLVQGAANFEAINRSLTRVLGPPVYQGSETSWDTPGMGAFELHTYRVVAYRI